MKNRAVVVLGLLLNASAAIAFEPLFEARIDDQERIMSTCECGGMA